MTKIQEKLKEQNKSVYALAKYLGESPQNTGNFVKRINFKEFKKLKKTSEFLGCKINDLV